MNRIRQYIIVSLVVIPVVILVVIRETSTDRFKFNARKLAESSFTKTNLLPLEQLATLAPESLIIDLSGDSTLLKNHPGDVVNIPFGSLLEKNSLKVMQAHKGPLLLYSEEPGISAKAWMLLAEMGYHDLYILTAEADNEVMKYKFRPDTIPAGTAL